ncbi:MAG TPA: hypothetical protein VMH80_28380 [Bryobacteraceae bacterium]|nr:hypothetical protein [Bryobacteraceae bacterium]
MSLKLALAPLAAAVCLFAAEKYTGPIPPKPDIPYLLHASNLLETEPAQAHEGKRDTFVISGAASPARTPLAEPIFILDARQLSPETIELYRLDLKGGNRELSFTSGRHGGRSLHLTVRPLTGHLYRLEADEPLENGEYALSPNGSNQSFCFEIY